MANNRMWLICEQCGGRKLLAKYYPDTGWFMECLPDAPIVIEIGTPEEIRSKIGHLYKVKSGENFASWVALHTHDDGTFEMADTGPTHFKLEYEGLHG